MIGVTVQNGKANRAKVARRLRASGKPKAASGKPVVIKVNARAFHATRHIVGVALGIAIMLIAVRWEYHPLVGKDYEIAWGGFCWLLHGIGCVPICNHVDGLWDMFN